MKTRQCIQQLEPYGYIMTNEDLAKQYGLPVASIDRLDRNTVYYTLEAVEKALRMFGEYANRLRSYPNACYPDLTRLIAGYCKVKESQVVLGNGADEIIDIIARAYLELGDRAIVSVPTFSFYKVSISIAGGETVEVPREKNFELNIGTLLNIARRKNAKMIFICNPNNPDGSLVDNRVIEALVSVFDGLVIIDEAYIEFSEGESVAALCSKYENIVVIRTLSKAFGLAGVRVGYALCPESVAEQLNKIRQPYNVDCLSQVVAEAALSKDGITEMKRRVSEIVEERKILENGLSKLGFFVYPSAANFLLIRSYADDVRNVIQKMLAKGIIIRGFGSSLQDCIRITVGSKEQNSRLLSELAKIYDGIIFDVDGVLVDVSKSYRKAIKKTVLEMAERTLTNEDVERIKALPGFNNDWDVTYALVKQLKDISEINRSDPLYQETKKKFQEIYEEVKKDEKLLVKEETLKTLQMRGLKLGIATGRPREEVLDSLGPFIPTYFSENNIVAMEDCTKEKPDPEPLSLAKNKLGCRRAVYVGDTINDGVAAQAAGFGYLSIGPQKSDIADINQILEVLE